MPLVRLIVCGFLVIATPAWHVLCAQAKPVQETHAVYDAGGPPATLDELFSKSIVVVDGVVQGEHPADQVHPNVDPRKPPTAVFTFTVYDIAVREVFKTAAPMPPHTVLPLFLPGGRRDRGSYIEDEFDVRFPIPKRGEEYVLFLRIATDPGGTWHMPTMGLGESVFLVEEGKLVPRGHGPVARLYDGRSLRDLQNTLRKRSAKRE